MNISRQRLCGKRGDGVLGEELWCSGGFCGFLSSKKEAGFARWIDDGGSYSSADSTAKTNMGKGEDEEADGKGHGIEWRPSRQGSIKCINQQMINGDKEQILGLSLEQGKVKRGKGGAKCKPAAAVLRNAKIKGAETQKGKIEVWIWLLGFDVYGKTRIKRGKEAVRISGNVDW